MDVWGAWDGGTRAEGFVTYGRAEAVRVVHVEAVTNGESGYGGGYEAVEEGCHGYHGG